MPVVLAGQRTDSGISLARFQFHGTAFSLAPGFFFTAAHVLEAARAAGPDVVLGLVGRGEHVFSEIVWSEVFPTSDTALIASDLPADVLEFEARTLQFCEDVQGVGWAFGPDPEYFTVVPRAFKGSVVTRRRIFRVGPFELADQPAGYELTFGVPGGLSGGPLLTASGGKVAGMLVGNNETSSDGAIRQLGIALDVDTFLRLHSSRLGRPIAHLIGRSVLPARVPFQKVERDSFGWPKSGSAPDVEGWPDE